MVGALTRQDGEPPIYVQIQNVIRERIERGEWTPGTMLPSEREFRETYGIARMTVRQAISALVAEGLLTRVHGKGTFVIRPPLRQSLSKLTSFSEDMRDRGLVATTRLLARARQAATEEEAALLTLPVGAPVLYLRRLRLANGRPMAIETCTLRGDVGLPLLQEDLEHQSLYRLLQERCGLRLSRAGQEIAAGSADAEEARLLDILRGAAVLHIQRTSFACWDGQEAPFEHVRSTYRSDRYRFYVELER